MASYQVPQVEIHQILGEAPANLTTEQVPFVFGPNYQLHRYSDASEKEEIGIGFYDSEVNDTSGFYAIYPNALDEEMVDKSYTKLYGDNVYVKLGEFADIKLHVADQGTSDSSDDYVYTNHLLVTMDASSDPDIAELAVGRMIRIFYGTTEPYAYKDLKILKIDEDNSTVDATCVVVDEDLDADIHIVKGYLCELQNGVEFPRKDFTDENKTNYFWKEWRDTDKTSKTYGHYGIQVVGSLYAYYVDEDYEDRTPRYGKVLEADLYLTYRELLTASADTIHSLVNASEVANALGTVSPDNPLAQAVYNVALNSAGQTIRYMAIPTTDLSKDGNDEDALSDGYNTVLNAATLTKEVYFMVPVTRNGTILDLVKAHVNSMSAATTKRWRIAFVSAEIPEIDPIYTSLNNPDGDDFYARVESLDEMNETADVWFYDKIETAGDPVYRESTYTSFKKDLKVGDILYINYHQEWGKSVPVTVKITRIINNTRIRVDNSEGKITKVTPTVDGVKEYKKAEIYHPYTSAETATEIKNISSAFADRRMYNVFPSVFANNGTQMTGEFAAACVAGLVSACLPQQPVTNLKLTGIDDIPLVYQTFSFDQLNTMASGGTFIVMQDVANGPVYVRHQISTAYADNNLNTQELSITKNLDSISFFFDDLLSPYIGKYNITPRLLVTLRNAIEQGLTELEMDTNGLYGPQVIADGTTILLLEQDALLKDHVNCNLQLNLPYPFNHLVLKLFV